MNFIGKLALLFLIVILLGIICSIGEYVYTSIGIFGPIVFLGVIFFFLSMAFKD
jgi:hypothetical protein